MAWCKGVSLLAGIVVLVGGCGSDGADSTSSTTAPTTTVSTSTPSSVATTTTTVPTFPYLYVWPFRSAADAQQWQRSYRAGGHQPWHLDAGMTAHAFTTFLDVDNEIGEVIEVTEDAAGAHVAMGFHNPNGLPVVAVTIHEVRIGAGIDAPWEVVGDDQTSRLTLTAPEYGTSVSSPISVRGRITGVDENIRVRVHQPSSEPGRFLGEQCCLPAGGESAPWSMTVAYAGATDAVLVITASTGGHLQNVEQLAFTAVQQRG